MSVGFSTGPIVGDLTRPAVVPSAIGEDTDWLQSSTELARSLENRQAETGLPALGWDPDPLVARVQAMAPRLPIEPAVDPATLNQQFGIKGSTPGTSLSFDAPLPQSVAQNLYDNKREELLRQDAALRSPGGLMHGVANFGVDTVKTMLDPVNAPAFMIPYVGPARWALAAEEGGSLGVRALARAGVGAVQGAEGMVPIAALKYGLAAQDQSDYGATSALLDIAYGGAFGAGLHPIAGMGGDLVGKFFAHEQPAAATAEPEADLATREAALRTALAQQIEGRPVEVRPVFDPADPSLGPAARAAAGEPDDAEVALSAAATAAQNAPAEPGPEPLQPFDLRGAARAIDPETVGAFEDLEQQREALRGRLSAPEGEAAPGDLDRQAQAAGQQVSDLQRQFDGFTAAGNKDKAALFGKRLAQAQAELEDATGARDQAITGPLRDQLMAADQRMRDLAPQFSTAMEAARAQRAAAVGPPRNVPLIEASLTGDADAIAQMLRQSSAPGAPKSAVRFGPVDPRVVALAKGKGIELDGFDHVMPSDDVRHALARHGAGARLPANQLPLMPDDLARVPEITATADRVTRETGSRGLPVLRFVKRDGLTDVVVEEVRSGRRHLAFKTMYRLKPKDEAPGGPAMPTDQEGAGQTSETAPGSAADIGAEAPQDKLGMDLSAAELADPEIRNAVDGVDQAEQYARALEAAAGCMGVK